MTTSRVPTFIETGRDAPRPDLPFEERDAVGAVVRDPKTGAYLCLRWSKIDWETFITGGIESGQSAEAAARAEVLQETGYKNLRLVKELPPYHAKFYHGPKNVNRHAHFRSFLFELENDERAPVTEEEAARHESVWLSPERLKTFRLPEGHRFLLAHV